MAGLRREGSTAYCYTETQREQVGKPMQNTERTSRKSPAALRGNTGVPEYRNGFFREKSIYF